MPSVQIIKKLTFLSLFAILSTGCQPAGPSNNSAEPDWYGNFYVRFVAGDNQYKAEAKFKPADAAEEQTKWVEPDGDVYFSDKKLRSISSEQLGFFYSLQFKSSFQHSHRFLLNDLQVPALINPISGISTDGPIRIKEGFRLTWEGNPLQEDETLVLLLTDSKGQVHSVNRLGPSSTAATQIFPEQLVKVAPGAGEISIVRKKRTEIPEGESVKGIVMTEYYTESIKTGFVE